MILLDDLDKQVELDPSLMAPLTKLIASSKVFLLMYGLLNPRLIPKLVAVL